MVKHLSISLMRGQVNYPQSWPGPQSVG